jgi:hypothetical protein
MKRRELLGASAATLGAALLARADTETAASKGQRLHMALMLLCLNPLTYKDFTTSYTVDAHGNQIGPPLDPNLVDIDRLNHTLYLLIQKNLATAASTFQAVQVNSITDVLTQFAVLAYNASGGDAAYGSPATCPCSNGYSCTTVQRLI